LGGGEKSAGEAFDGGLGMAVAGFAEAEFSASGDVGEGGE
jgi:hypothetical protein